MLNSQTIFLVVEDMETMRAVTAAQLRSLGAGSVLLTNNGAEALRVLQKQRVDIVLSDRNMPVMSGLELLKVIRSDERLSHLPFIMITAETERERVAEAVACGVSELLVKPYTADRLASRIEKALNSRPRSGSPVLAKAAAGSGSPKLAPVSVPAGTIKESADRVSPEPAAPMILIVDDTPANLQLLSHLFEDEYRVRVATNGQKALNICQSNDPPDLVLLDVMMPGMDGFEVARRMREHPTSESIPVIFVTAMDQADARLKGLTLGAVDFITKPIEPDVLKPRVRNFLRYVELHKQLQADYDGILEAARLREDVEQVMRHDLKGPLAGVIGLAQSLADDAAMSRNHVQQLRLLEQTTLQLLNMINLSSELFKIETGRFNLDAKPAEICDILQRIVEMSATTYAEKHLIFSFVTDVPAGREMPQVLGDAMFCYSLFQNLIKNACEAAPSGSRVSVTLNDDAPLRIAIQNKAAVPAEIRAGFFDKFVTHGKEGGTGLGTYSAKLLAEAQNGTIALHVSDQEDETMIIVTLPRYSIVEA
ncbi:MAG: hybrid sensor histidine kinase/response regulator [Rhodocyclaceae bacterium]|nr:MAG: hybrid sensor histidine kinase/response regulator [Rhodocyclaceae bacterium]